MRVPNKNTRLSILLLLLIAALAVRTLRAFQEPVVNPDTIRFINQAQLLATNPLAALHAEVYHPLHSAAGLATHSLLSLILPNSSLAESRTLWLVSFQSVGILAGSLLTLLIYRLARLFGAPFWPSAGAAALWVVGRRPVSFGPDGLSDMLFLLLFASSILLAISALRELQKSRIPSHKIQNQKSKIKNAFLLSGLLSGLAYLTRPEGLAASLIIATTLLLLALPNLRKSPPASRKSKLFPNLRLPLTASLASILFLLLGTLLPAAPYMYAIGGLTQKKSLTTHLPIPTPTHLAAPFAPTRSLPLIQNPKSKIENAQIASLPIPSHDLYKLAMELSETFGFAPASVLAFAMLFKPRLWGRPRLRILAFVWFSLWTSVMLWLLHKAGYLDGRHTLPVQLPLYALFALALVAIRTPILWWRRFLQSLNRGRLWALLPPFIKSPRWIPASLLILTLLALLPGIIRLVTPQIDDRFYIREAATWIETHTSPDTLILDSDQLLGYYANRPYALYLGSAELPQLDVIQTRQLTHRPSPDAPLPPILIARIYRPSLHDHPAPNIGPYKPIIQFTSPNTDTLVLYRN